MGHYRGCVKQHFFRLLPPGRTTRVLGTKINKIYKANYSVLGKKYAISISGQSMFERGAIMAQVCIQFLPTEVISLRHISSVFTQENIWSFKEFHATFGQLAEVILNYTWVIICTHRSLTEQFPPLNIPVRFTRNFYGYKFLPITFTGTLYKTLAG